jgi:hypothetical protein
MADELQHTSAIPGLPPDWPQRATERIVDLVDTTKVKTTGPAIKISRGVVYGLVATLIGVVLVPMLLIGITRGVVILFDLFVTHERAVWITYLLLGAILSGLGFFLWSRRPKGAAVPSRAA